MLTRRSLAGLALLPIAAGVAAPVRIGLQKAGSLVLLRQPGWLDELGHPVQWIEFPSGPAIMEAMNAGSVDFAGCGDTPPIFAQAAGADLVYVGAQPNDGANIGIVVRADGPIRTVADLRGKRLAFTRGSTVQNLVVRGLASAGLRLADVQAALLPVADGAAAFQTGAVDAFAAWDPYFGIAQSEPGVRVLLTGAGVAPTNFFFMATRGFATAQPGTLRMLLETINAAAAWAKANPDQADAAGDDQCRRRVGEGEPGSGGADHGRDHGGADRAATHRRRPHPVRGAADEPGDHRATAGHRR